MYCNSTQINCIDQFVNYNEYKLTYIILSSFLFVLSIILSLYFKKHKKNHMKNMYNLNVIFMSICMVMYSVDPNGLNNIYPTWFVILLSDLTTCSGISIIFFYIYILIFARCHLYHTSIFINKIKIFHISIYILIFLLGLLQTFVNNKLFYSIKMFTFVVILGIVTVYFNKSMKYLIELVGDHHVYKTKINKLKNYMYIYNVLIFLIMGFQLYIGINNLLKNIYIQTKYIPSSEWIFLFFKCLSILLFWCFSIDWSNCFLCKKKETMLSDFTTYNLDNIGK